MLQGKSDNLWKMRKIGFLYFEKCNYWLLQGLRKWHGYLCLCWNLPSSTIPMIRFPLPCLNKTEGFFLSNNEEAEYVKHSIV